MIHSQKIVRMRVLHLTLVPSLIITIVLCSRLKRNAERPSSPVPSSKRPFSPPPPCFHPPWIETPKKCTVQSDSIHPTKCPRDRTFMVSPHLPSFDLGISGRLAAACEEYVHGGGKFASHLLRELKHSNLGTMMEVRKKLGEHLMRYSRKQHPTAYDELRRYFKAKDIHSSVTSYKLVDIAFLEALRIKRVSRIVHRLDNQLGPRVRKHEDPKGLVTSANFARNLPSNTAFSKACEAYIHFGNSRGQKVNHLLKRVARATLESTKEDIKSIIRDYVLLEGPLGANEISYYLACKPDKRKKTYKLAKRAFANVQRVRRAFQLYHLIKVRLFVLSNKSI